MPDRAPPQHRHLDVARRTQLHLEVGHRIGQVGDTFDRGMVDALLDQERLHRGTGDDRLADDAVVPGLQLAGLIQADARTVQVHRAEEAATGIVLTRPDHLHRCVHALVARGLGDRHGLQQVIRTRAGTAPETAAGIQLGQRHLFRLEAQVAADDRLVDGLELLAVPDLAAIGGELHQAVHRLHRRVRQVRELVVGLDGFRRLGQRRIGVATGGRRQAGLAGTLAVLGEDFLAAEGERLALVPVDHQGITPLARGPGVLRQHGDAGTAVRQVAKLHHVDHVAHGLGLAAVDGTRHATKTRRIGDHRHQHARQFEVLGEHGTAVGLARAVLAAQLDLADQLEVLRLLELHLLGHRQRRSRFDQLAETGTAPRAGVTDHPLADADFTGRHCPALRRRSHQHGLGRGPGVAHLLPGVGHGGTATRALHRAEGEVVVAFHIGRRAFDAHCFPIGVQLFGQQRGQAGVAALAHLQVFGQHGHAAIQVDPHEGVRLQRATCGQCIHAADQRREENAQRQPARALEQRAAADVEDAASGAIGGFDLAHDSALRRKPVQGLASQRRARQQPIDDGLGSHMR